MVKNSKLLICTKKKQFLMIKLGLASADRYRACLNECLPNSGNEDKKLRPLTLFLKSSSLCTFGEMRDQIFASSGNGGIYLFLMGNPKEPHV